MIINELLFKKPPSQLIETHKTQLYCHFCGKNKEEVVKLVAAPTAMICDECVDACVKCLNEPEAKAVF